MDNREKEYKTALMLCRIMIASPVIVALLLWLIIGFAGQTAYGVNEYYIQMAMTVTVIVSIPLLLKYVTRRRCGVRYLTYCLVRMGFMELLAFANIILYFSLHITSLFYLAVIVWLAMFFAMPTVETDRSTENTDCQS
ncbi:MAG: hypothetical protein Q4E63_05985 [Prevotellaceae bacterium]|nr:hypothetical protein [Prevotellaceae bacterium]MDO4932181.1 hypothetical protein [Prevotellaceae bacterium]